MARIGVAGADLRLLRVFMTIAKRGGFAASQAELNISPSTISNHIKALEDRLAVTLCRRGRGGFALTREGQRVYDAAERLFASLDGFAEEVEALRSRPAGHLHLGLGDGLDSRPSAALQAALSRLHQLVPGIEVTLQRGSVMDLQNRVRDGRLQAALVGLPLDLPLLRQEGLAVEEIYREPMMLCCGRGHALFESPGVRLKLDELRRQAIVVRDNWPEHMVRRLQAGAVRARAEAAEGVLSLVLAGTLLGYLPAGFAMPWIAMDELRELHVEGAERAVSLCLVARSEGAEPENVGRLRAALREVAADRLRAGERDAAASTVSPVHSPAQTHRRIARRPR
jgi:DNA-binding transcriptional LysR family regulator